MCDLIIKQTDDSEFLDKQFADCQKVRPLNEPSEKLGRTYFIVAAQFGSVEIMKHLNGTFPNLKLDILDNMGRGIFANSKDEQTRFIALAIAYKKPMFLSMTSEEYQKTKAASDSIKEIWKSHLKNDDIDNFKEWLAPTPIWDLIGVDGYSILHAAAQNRTGRQSDLKLDEVVEKFEKNAISLNLIEISMGRSPALMALAKNQSYAVCRLTVEVEDIGFLLPDIEGHSLDF